MLRYTMLLTTFSSVRRDVVVCSDVIVEVRQRGSRRIPALARCAATATAGGSAVWV